MSRNAFQAINVHLIAQKMTGVLMGTQIETDHDNMTVAIEDMNSTHIHIYLFYVPGQVGVISNHLFLYVQYNLQAACAGAPSLCSEEDLLDDLSPVYGQIVPYEVIFRVSSSDIFLSASVANESKGKKMAIQLTNLGLKTLIIKKILSDLQLKYPNSNVFIDEDFEDESECFQHWIIHPDQTRTIAQTDYWVIPERQRQLMMSQYVTVSVAELNSVGSGGIGRAQVRSTQKQNATIIIPLNIGEVKATEEYIDLGIFTDPSVK